MAHRPNTPQSLAQLFRVFAGLSLAGFGGVLPIAEDRLVRRERWIEEHDFYQTLSLAQILPGPNICNMAVMLGDRFFGLRGALAALAGLILPPLLPVLALAFFYTAWSDSPLVSGALRAMAMAAAGLMLAMALRLGSGLSHPRSDYVIAALVVVAIAVLRLPLAYTLLGVGALSLAIALRRS